MKRKYIRPDISFEYFKLTQSIAENCGIKHEGNSYGQHQFAHPMSCAWKDPLGTLIWFTTTIDADTVCTLQIDEKQDAAGLCYNNPEGMMNVFGS